MNWELHAQAWTYVGWTVLAVAACFALCAVAWALLAAWGRLERVMHRRGGDSAVERLRMAGIGLVLTIMVVGMSYGLAAEKLAS